MRWQIVIPLALIFTALALAGSHLISGVLDNRQLNVLVDDTITAIERDGDAVLLTIAEDKSLGQVLTALANFAAADNLTLVRENREPAAQALAQQVELLVAQAVATREYYSASLMLSALAEQYGYQAQMSVRAGMLLVEVDDGVHSLLVFSRTDGGVK